MTTVLFSIIYFGLYDFYFDTVNTKLFIAFIILILPLLLYKDIFHPLIVYSLFQSLVLIDLLNKSLEKPIHLRYLFSSANEAKSFLSSSITLWSIWYLLLLVGFAFSNKVKLYHKKKCNGGELNYDIKFPTIIALIFILLGSVSFFYAMFVINSGFSSMLESMRQRVETYEGLAYVTFFTQLGVVGSILLLFRKHKVLSIITLVIFSFMISLYGSRGTVLNLLISYMLAYNYKIKKINIYKIAFVGFVGLLFVKIYGEQRFSGKFSLNNDTNNIVDLIAYAASQKQSGDILPSLIGALKKNVIDFQLGKDFFNIIFAPIPRKLWETKPQIDHTGIIGKLLMGEDFWGLPAGAYGWIYLNFWWFGIIFFGFMTGFIAAKIYKYAIYQARRGSDYVFLFYILSVTSLMEMFTTASQVRIIFYFLIIMILKLMDKIILAFHNRHRLLLR